MANLITKIGYAANVGFKSAFAAFSSVSGLGTARKFWASLNGTTIEIDLSNHKGVYEAYVKCPPISAIISRKAAMLNNGEWEFLNANNDKYLRGAEADYYTNLFSQPNPLQTRQQWLSQVYTYMMLFGYCPILLIEPIGFEWDRKDVRSMWCLPPWLLDIQFDTSLGMVSSTSENFIKSVHLTYNGKRTQLSTTSLIFLKDDTQRISLVDADGSLFLPDSRLRALKWPISNIAVTYQSENVLISKKGAIGILSNVGKDESGTVALKPQEKEDLQNDFNKYGLSHEQWQVIITNASLQWQQMSFPVKDLMLRETRTDAMMAICNGLNFKAELLSSEKGPTFNNQKEIKKAVYQDAIIPESKSIAQQISRAFKLKENGVKLEISFDDVEALQQGEEEKARAKKVQAEAFEKMFKNNLITLNWWRQQQGIDVVPGEDLYYYQMRERYNAAPGQQQNGNNANSGNNSQQQNAENNATV